MAKTSKTDAEVKYARAQKRMQEAAKAQTEVQAEAKRFADNTVRLKALRLAKEAADAAAKAAAKPVAKAKKAKAKAPAKSIPAEKLTAANDD